MTDDFLSVAIVTPWFGADLTGGAERTAWQVAHGLAERGHRLAVFTTCARAFRADWGVAAHRPGTQIEDGIEVRRFPVDARDANAFDRANEVLLAYPPGYHRAHPRAIEAEIAEAFVRDGINSTAAVEALGAEADRFDAVIVLPYLYGIGLSAIRAVGRRAILQPCLHDEPYAYLPAVEYAFRTSGALLFNTEAERRLAYRLFGPSIALKSLVVGLWVDESDPPAALPSTVCGFRPGGRRYVLYLGRRDATKNVDVLLESFATFRRRERMSRLELVLAGPGSRSFADPRHGIWDLGEVNDAQKAALLGGAWALAQPSLNESFSRVVMEAWSAGAPVLVNGRCEATADTVRETSGGWTATTKAEWSATFRSLDRLAPEERANYAERGRRYVAEQTARDRILDRYEAATRSLRVRSTSSRFDVPPAAELVRRLSDGRRTILYAGPLVETACIEQLLTAFAFLLSFGIDARLVLLGAFDPEERLEDRFFELVASSGLRDRVVVLEPARRELVAACYRCADLFWSAADDGPAQELVDAMGYGVPVFAFANPFAARVLGQSGLLFKDKTDPRALAGIAAMILTDLTLRDKLTDGQRRRFVTFSEHGELERAG